MSVAIALADPLPASPPTVTPTVLRYGVVGAGAIGAYVGASIAKAGGNVTLIARGAHCAAMRENGVTVLSERGDFQVRCTATDDPSTADPFDCLIVALKANQIAAMLPAIKRMCHDRTRVIAMQNGIPWWYFQRHGGPLEGLSLRSVDPGGQLAAAFDPDRVIGCVIYSSTELEAPGVVRHIEGTRYALGRPDGAIDGPLEEISAALIAGGLKAPIEHDLRAQIWVKLLGNAAVNPISALTRGTLGVMLSNPAIEALVREIMEECVAIAEALGVTLPVSIDKRIDGARRVGDHKTSMLQDVERGRSLELDCMTGAVVELGEILGSPTPATRHVHALVGMLGSAVCAA
jgi:2-dehydropantoate 2-reductase